jgi:hypothetical protein
MQSPQVVNGAVQDHAERVDPEAQNVISKNPFSVTAKSDFSLKTPVEWQG